MKKEIHLEQSDRYRQTVYDLVIDGRENPASPIGWRLAAFGYVVTEIEADFSAEFEKEGAPPVLTIKLVPLTEKSHCKRERRAEPMRPKKRRIAQIS